MENEEQLKVVKKLKDVLHILTHVRIKNEESLGYISKPLDDLLSSIKYLPVDPPFSSLPTEIKTNILGYLCNSGTFLASSVCQEWKQILKPQLDNLSEVRIGKHYSNKYECEGIKCYTPEGMLSAVTTLKPDIPLVICHPLTKVDTQLVTEGLTSASSLTVVGDCKDCVGVRPKWWEVGFVGSSWFKKKPILTSEQVEQLLIGLENKSGTMEMVKLQALKFLNLTNLDRDRFVNFLVHKNRIFHIDGRSDYNAQILDLRTLVNKLKDSSDIELKELVLGGMIYKTNIAEDLADALCKVKYVCLEDGFYLQTPTLNRLILNILTRPVVTENLLLQDTCRKWGYLLEPQRLKALVDKMTTVDLWGTFSPQQLEAVTSSPGVQASLSRISKGVNV